MRRIGATHHRVGGGSSRIVRPSNYKRGSDVLMADRKSDILEDTIELEGLRGTVRGLDSWVNRWQRQRESSLPSHKSDIRKSKGRSYWRRKSSTVASNEEEEDDGNDFNTFLDGVLAWMRGWNDVEEGFLIRARRRKLRRNRKELGLLDTQAL